MTNEVPKYSFDEFKIVYESTEKVTDRRLQTNRWNYTICTAVLVAIAGIIKYSVSNEPFFYIGLMVALVLSGMATLFCCLWVGQIKDFKSLNHAKFDVLNEMAPHLEYNPEHPGVLKPFCPFKKEWDKLEEMKALQEKGKTDFIALKSTNIEYYIPKAFIALFALVVIVVGILLLPNKDRFNKPTSVKPQTVTQIPRDKP